MMRSQGAMGAPIGLYAHVRANHTRSLLLFGCFLLAFHLMSGVMLTIPLAIFDPAHGPLTGFGGYARRYLVIVTLVGAVIFALRYWWHVSAVYKDTGFHYVDDSDEPRLVSIVEPLIIAGGIHPPFLGVIEDEAMNAFAVGVRDKHMVVVVTRGLIDGLDDEELEAVLAHELMHIRFRDTRLMAAANAFLGNLTALRKQVINDKKIEQPRAVLGFIALPGLVPLFLGLGFLGELAHRIGYFSRAAIGSAREFIADAEAVRLTHNPAALASALRQVDGRDRIANFAESHDAMLIAGAVEGPAATHPSIAQRIAALIQTTGPAMAYAPARRDSRTPEQRRRAGFGRSLGVSLMDEVQTAKRPTLWQIFRLARDPGRNIFGLRRKGSQILLAGSIGFVLFWGGVYYATGRKADFRTLRTTATMMRVYMTCEVHGMGMLAGISKVPAECSNENVDALAQSFSGQTGLPYQSETERRRKEQDAAWRTWRVNRCFPYSLHPWNMIPSRLASSDQRATWDVSFYQQFADEPIAGIERRPKESYAQSLAEYVEMRVLMADNGRYFFGADGYKQIAAMFNTPRHQKALAVFRENMKRPEFAAWFASHGDHQDSARVLAEMPDAIPCDALIADGRFKRD
jgi:Zn-dependent protease with chaperone function